MPSLHDVHHELARALDQRYGTPQSTAAPRPTWERVLASALECTLAAGRVDRILEGLKDAGLLEPDALAQASPLELVEAARQAGASLPKPAVHVLRRLARWLIEHHEGSAEGLVPVATERLREELTALVGIGPATADAILLFALERLVYPVDRASFRILVRHGWLDPSADYQEARAALEALSPENAQSLQRVSVWFERVGRDFCGPTTAKCDRCPLQPFLPEGGAREPG
jgi:endonuclease III related protein